MTYFVYILELEDSSYYVGFTSDLSRKMSEHSLGIAGKHTKKIRMKILRWPEELPDRKAARAREKEIKRWRREKKESLWNESSLS